MSAVFAAISLIFCTAIRGGVAFEPDWDTRIPIDAFETSKPDKLKSITVVYEDGSFILRKNQNGTLAMFPFNYKGSLIQITTAFNSEKVSGFSAVCEGTQCDIEFLEYAQGTRYKTKDSYIYAPSIARVNLNGTYYFVSFAYYADEIIETWFSDEGGALMVYKIYLSKNDALKWARVETNTEDSKESVYYFYDSFGHNTSVQSEQGTYSTLYTEKGIRYLERTYKPAETQPENGAENEASGEDNRETENIFEQYEFQLNERGLPVRSSKSSGGEQGGKFSYEYRYKFDGDGNWIEREEIVMEEKLGALLPVEENLVKRSVEYYH